MTTLMPATTTGYQSPAKMSPLAATSAKNLALLLDSHHIKNQYHESEGAHTWINWRHYLNEYAQLLFR